MNNQQGRLILFGILMFGVTAFIVLTIAGMSILSGKSRKMTELKVQSTAIEAQVEGLAAAKKEVEKYAYFNDIAKTVLPSDKNQTQAVADLVQLADEAGFSIQNITFPNSTLGTNKPATSSSETGSTASSASTPAAPGISQAKPVPGIPGLYAVQVNISPASGAQVPPGRQVTYAKLLNFLNRLEKNRRTAQITQVTIQPQAGQDLVNFSLTLNIFIRP